MLLSNIIVGLTTQLVSSDGDATVIFDPVSRTPGSNITWNVKLAILAYVEISKLNEHNVGCAIYVNNDVHVSPEQNINKAGNFRL